MGPSQLCALNAFQLQGHFEESNMRSWRIFLVKLRSGSTWGLNMWTTLKGLVWKDWNCFLICLERKTEGKKKKKQRCQKLGGMQTQKHKLKAVSTCSCYTKYSQSLPQVNIFLSCLFISKFYEPWPSFEKFNIFPLNTLRNIFKGPGGVRKSGER